MDTKMKNLQQQILRLIVSNWISRLVFTAVYLGIPDLLSGDPVPMEKIAEDCECQPDQLYRVMRALAGAGFFIENKNKHFSHSPLSEMISSNTMGPIIRMFLAPWHNAAWDMLPRAVETGEPGFRFAHGKDAFTWFNDNPDEEDIFQQANSLKAAGLSEKLAKSCSFGDGETIIDIGGGYGNILIGLLNSNKTLKGIVADLPPVVKRAEAFIKKNGLHERCRAVECDFFHEVPAGGDTIILCNILHDWNDEKAGLILENCRRAMKSGSKLLVMEMILPADGRASFAQLMDIEVMVMGNGRERSEEEFRMLLHKAGFSFRSINPLDGETFLIESVAK